MQLHYNMALDAKYGNKIPFGGPVWFARFYVRFAIVLTVAYQIIVIAILNGTPILDSAKGGDDGTWERTVFKILTKIYSVVALVIPIACSYWEISNGDTNTFTMALQ